MVKIKLQTKIFLYFVLLILIVLVLFGSLLFTQISAELSNGIYNNLKQRSAEVKDDIDYFMDRGYRDIQVVSSDPIIRSDRAAPEEKLEILNILQNTYRIYDKITLIDTNGDVIVSTAYRYRTDWSDNEQFLEAARGEALVSDVHTDPDTSEVVILFLSPVLGEGNEIIAVVANQMPMNNLWEMIDEIKWDSGFVFVENSLGKIVSHPNKNLILEDSPYDFDFSKLLTSGVIEFKDEGNNIMVAGYSTLFRTGDYKGDEWKVFAAQPRDDAFFVVTSLFNSFISIILIALIIALLTGFILSKRITKPISSLVRGIKRITTGDWNYKLEIRSNDEIEELANSFNEMTGMFKEKELLERLKSDLQKKVNELEKLNKVMVGREAEIVKLKNEIKKLKGKG